MQAFMQAFTVSGLEAMEIQPLSATFESISPGDLSIDGGSGLTVDYEGITARTEKRRGGGTAKGGELIQVPIASQTASATAPKSATEVLFRVFAEVVKGKDEKAVLLMSRVFAKKNEHCLTNAEEINIPDLISEADNLLKRLEKPANRRKTLTELYPEWF